MWVHLCKCRHISLSLSLSFSQKIYIYPTEHFAARAPPNPSMDVSQPHQIRRLWLGGCREAFFGQVEKETGIPGRENKVYLPKYFAAAFVCFVYFFPRHLRVRRHRVSLSGNDWAFLYVRVRVAWQQLAANRMLPVLGKGGGAKKSSCQIASWFTDVVPSRNSSWSLANKFVQRITLN